MIAMSNCANNTLTMNVFDVFWGLVYVLSFFGKEETMQKLFLFLIKLNQKKTNGGPYQFAYSYDEGHKDAGIGGQCQSCGRHHETTFSAAQLQRHEEQHVCDEGGEGQNEYALQVTGFGLDNQ